MARDTLPGRSFWRRIDVAINNNPRPLPRFPEPDTESFWTATREHRLMYQLCNDCGGLVFYARRHCIHCLGDSLNWHESSGTGTIYSFTVVRRSAQPFFADRLPYIIVIVDLAEGFRMLSELVGTDPRQVRIGDPVVLDWEDHATLSLPLFRVTAHGS